ncbi:MAG: transposase, partial [Candidatus Hydrogenedentes bacterium]|nr:transposase [Candidatus Hydrogenedentota bacterium]
GFPHHVTQRGNRRADVFESDEDRHGYLGFLKKYCGRHGLDVWAYCLMSNHVHLVVVPQREESLARALRDAHTVYAMRFNTRTGLNGHVWQGRFYSCVLDEAHLWAAVRYVERNPVRAGMVERAEDYPWSSAPGHCGLRRDALLSTEFPPVGVVENWAAWLRTEDGVEAIDRIRRQTRTGRPCGAAGFMARLENLLGRIVGPAKRGRKPKTQRTQRATGSGRGNS